MNELLRGLIFFLGLGLLYLLFTLVIEYFLWLKPAARTVLFWMFILVEVVLLARYIIFPLSRLFKIREGLSYNDASAIIGRHFPEVADKLTNFLQLSDSTEKSELLLASISQKAELLKPVPFTTAVDFSGNKKFLPIVLLPVLFFAFFYISGNSKVISQSFNRVVNYRQQFIPPAPFRLVVVNQQLQAEQGSDFVLVVKSVGSVVPESAMIYVGDESYFMENKGGGNFEYTFVKASKDTEFYIKANSIESAEYKLSVVAVPTIANFEMHISFPAYLNRKPELLQGTGNAIVPEGSKVNWVVHALATSEVRFTSGTEVMQFKNTQNRFTGTRTVNQNTDYQIVTSNKAVKEYEKLNYQISVIKDQYPTISVSDAPDSLRVGSNVLIGQVGDDHGLTKLQIVYYPKGNTTAARKVSLPVKRDIFDQFVFSFPGSLPVIEGVAYEFYFEVFDNDTQRNYKSSRSSVFASRIETQEEVEQQLLHDQNSNINSLEKSIKNQDRQMIELDKLQKMTKEKESLDFKDQQKVKDFIKKQQNQDEMMKQFAEKMKKNLEEFKAEKKDEFKDKLMDRIEKAEKEVEKNQKLLDELKQLNEKIQQDELMQKMEQFKQTSKNQVRNLQQLVELTKRYYVEKKAEQLAERLDKLGDKQEELSESNDNSVEKQEALNKEFDKLQEELKGLEKQNNELKSPMDIPADQDKQESIDNDMEKAKDELKKNDPAKAKPKQKNAARKMKEMGAKMEQGLAGGEKEQIEEDVKMLRQILDNLLAYSYSEEGLMREFRGLKRGSPSFNKNLKLQQDLKLQFKHVDDSLFAMSLRNPMIGEEINKEIGNVHYNMDHALENLVEARMAKGVSHQQYAVAAANRLADMLSEALNGMQMQMSGMGAGKGKPKPGDGPGLQLPDIIQKQKGLGEKMKDGMKQGDKPGDKAGDKPGDKSGDRPGQQGQSGKSGTSGNNGKGTQGQAQDGEGEAEAIMEIYKEQRQLREALQNELNKKGLGNNGKQALDQMKEIEKQLLNKGFKNDVLQKILNVQHELLKLDRAAQLQGEENKRQSEVNRKEFNGRAGALDPALQQYLNSIEILNRQSLPLHSEFNRRVQEYFKTK